MSSLDLSIEAFENPVTEHTLTTNTFQFLDLKASGKLSVVCQLLLDSNQVSMVTCTMQSCDDALVPEN